MAVIAGAGLCGRTGAAARSRNARATSNPRSGIKIRRKPPAFSQPRALWTLGWGAPPPPPRAIIRPTNRRTIRYLKRSYRTIQALYAVKKIPSDFAHSQFYLPRYKPIAFRRFLALGTKLDGHWPVGANQAGWPSCLVTLEEIGSLSCQHSNAPFATHRPTEARMPGCLPHGYRIGENGRPAKWMFETVETISALLQPGRFLMRCHPSLLAKVDQACPRASMSG